MRELYHILRDPMGLHARPAAVLMMAVKDCDCAVSVFCKGERADAKDLMEVLSLGGLIGDEVVFRAEGPDEDQAMEAIRRFLSDWQ